MAVKIIAEIGINHNGNLSIAKKMIQLAKNCGCDYVKFQKRTPEITTPSAKKNSKRDTPWGNITYLSYKKKIEFNRSQFDKIHKFSKKIGIKWFASAWDLKSLLFLKKYNLEMNKIASPMITNINFLNAVANEKKLTLISTGMSSLSDVDRAVNIFNNKKCKYVLLHCVSSYPCADKDLNLNVIKTLKKKYKCPVGYSGHESTVSPSIIAASLGATYIERHITLDRAMWGTDQAASLSPPGLKNLVETIRRINLILGDGKKKFLPEEKQKLKDMKYW